MRQFGRLGLGAGLMALAATGACSEGGTTAQAPGKQLKLAVAPLTLPNIGDACYNIRVTNGPNGTGDVVWSQGDVSGTATAATTLAAAQAEGSVCAGQYGNAGGGDIAYVGPCDASADGFIAGTNGATAGVDATRTHTVTLWIENLYQSGAGAGTEVDPAEWDNPFPPGSAGGSLAFECAENNDTAVVFNLVILRDANQGFFDVAVNFADIFCSGKVDCTDGAGDTQKPIQLLFNPATGDRGDTIVLGRSCTAGPNETTQIHAMNTYLTCGSVPKFADNSQIRPVGLVFGWDPTTGPGNQNQANLNFGWDPLIFNGQPPWAQLGADWIADPSLDSIVAQIAWQNANYAGIEQLPGLGKIYLNSALGFDFAALEKWWKTVAICQDTDHNGSCDCQDANNDGACDCDEQVQQNGMTFCCNSPVHDPTSGDLTACDGGVYIPGIDALPGSSAFGFGFDGCSILTSFTATDLGGIPANDPTQFSSYPFAASFSYVPTAEGEGDPLLGGGAAAVSALSVWGKGKLQCSQHPLQAGGGSKFIPNYSTVGRVGALLPKCVQRNQAGTGLVSCSN